MGDPAGNSVGLFLAAPPPAEVGVSQFILPCLEACDAHQIAPITLAGRAAEGSDVESVAGARSRPGDFHAAGGSEDSHGTPIGVAVGLFLHLIHAGVRHDTDPQGLVTLATIVALINRPRRESRLRAVIADRSKPERSDSDSEC